MTTSVLSTPIISSVFKQILLMLDSFDFSGFQFLEYLSKSLRIYSKCSRYNGYSSFFYFHHVLKFTGMFNQIFRFLLSWTVTLWLSETVMSPSRQVSCRLFLEGWRRIRNFLCSLKKQEHNLGWRRTRNCLCSLKNQEHNLGYEETHIPK